mmetsp:Transcript_4682/g.7174  ORF Transcript_4682/g.7174 Transcript_4682/m.7174 type:complete len:630 (-) Transcript_4682:1054-2943(-)
MVKRILLLHGNRQSGQLFLGRLERLKKRICKELEDVEFVAPDAPFPLPDDKNLRTWWNRVGNSYQGLEQSLGILKGQQEQNVEIIGILGFSQGARFAHLAALLHQEDPSEWFPNLTFVILVAGYDAPLPNELPPINTAGKIPLPSFHVWGLGDKLITPDQSLALSELYVEPKTLIHDGNHYVPTKAPQIQQYIDFITCAMEAHVTTGANVSSSVAKVSAQLPDEETTAMQEEEIEALEAIFFEGEIEIKSSSFPRNYLMKLLSTEEEEGSNWPPRPLTLQISYPFNYPLEAKPDFRLIHDNNVYEFPSKRAENTLKILRETAEAEIGMPSVLSCIYAVKEYLDSPATDTNAEIPVQRNIPSKDEDEQENEQDLATSSQMGPQKTSPENIKRGIIEGLEIAEQMLKEADTSEEDNAFSNGNDLSGKGGAFWTYTIGLVGKPSAGKSTFFNAASAFSKQRGVSEGTSEWGGASVAAHPFTTIDPNIGYCLVPAPLGSCPEDEMGSLKHTYGSTHGRDPDGQRLLPILLKDVAGLVPGAYQGRGKGNRFLNDLCDATVLVHVVDASGTADAQGNTTGDSALTNPVDDIQWIRAELVEWVYGNLMAKWDTITRKGRKKVRASMICKTANTIAF